MTWRPDYGSGKGHALFFVGATVTGFVMSSERSTVYESAKDFTQILSNTVHDTDHEVLKSDGDAKG
jgi:hypothetical protein